MSGKILIMVVLSALFMAKSSHAQSNQHNLPQIANGTFAQGSFRTTVILFNNNDASTAAILKFTDDSGNPITVSFPDLGTNNQFTINLSALARRILQTDGKGSLATGSATVTSTPYNIGVSSIFTIYDNNSNFVTEPGVGDSQPMTEFVLPVDVKGFLNTGLAMFNGEFRVLSG